MVTHFRKIEELTEVSAANFFDEQSFCGVAKDSESNIIVGLYILHPNNVGRCGHISNASFAVSSSVRGYGVGEILVKHCIEQARKLGFKILQFNAVVKSNTAALKLYKKLGFIQLGIIPNGFLLPNGTYEDITLTTYHYNNYCKVNFHLLRKLITILNNSAFLKSFKPTQIIIDNRVDCNIAQPI